MNYIVEDDFDFYAELKNIKNEEPSMVCMISHEPLTHNAITLPCKHSFNYMPLYKELCLHNNKQYINCPYCRLKSDKFIPYIPLPNVTKIVGVNYPSQKCMIAPKCAFILKLGMYKGLPCDQNAMEYDHGLFCNKHVKYNIDHTWTPEKEQVFKTKNVNELKEMLKSKGLRVGGIKKELVNRLFSEL